MAGHDGLLPLPVDAPTVCCARHLAIPADAADGDAFAGLLDVPAGR